jgi:hypothetical protein
MRLVARKDSAQARQDRLAFIRADGSSCEIDMPRQGILPHDLVHFAVEDGLRMHGGFLSMVANGADARFAVQVAHEPESRYTAREAVVAEAMVEALQSQLWNGAFDYAAFAYGLETACAVRGVDAPAAPAAVDVARVYDTVLRLHERWQALPPQAAIEFTFVPPA